VLMTQSDTRNNDQSAAIEVAVGPARSGLIGRFRDALRQFKRDIREPLPNAGSLTRFGRVKARVRHLFTRYGWKMFWGIVIFYLIRDVILYIILPYLVASKFLA